MEKLETIRMAGAMTAHAAERAKVIAGNVANSDTPGFRARDLRPFAETYRSAAANPIKATRAGHFTSSDAGRMSARLIEERGGRAPNGNNVSLEDEMVKNAETKRQHDLSIAVYRSSLTMLRTAMGRRG
ncbi:FlgB family protein [Paracoccus xiamenensis]|uniref:FlgB family protein n=1 Tax=Paracoccus xiamenensis TaxID=2714901 RepID=UPI002E2D4AA0|nr:FlgB family protein [Paracoccus xiamenensis]